MSINILMPALSPTMTEGKLSRWLKKEGDEIKSGDVLAEIETDKATMEVEAVEEGFLAKIVVPDGTEGVAVNAVIGVMTAEKGEAVDAPQPPRRPPQKRSSGGGAEGRAHDCCRGPGTQPKARRMGAVFASPLAKRIAKQAGIDLAPVKGSGPNGRIVKADLDGAGAAPAAAPAAAAPAAAQPLPRSAEAAGPAPAIAAPYKKIPNSSMRKVIARRLLESKQTVPHFYLTVNIELDAAGVARQAECDIPERWAWRFQAFGE